MTAPTHISHLKPLTGLRFMAALLVVMFHFLVVNVTSGPGPIRALQQIAHNIAASGGAGVSFFFVLSGFILTYNYVDARGQWRIDRRTFWVARFARIYPVYVIAFVIAAVPYLYWSHCTGAAPGCARTNAVVTGIATLTLLQGWIPFTETYWNGPGWSLSAEAFFYLLFPFIALYVARLSRRQLYRALFWLWAAYLAMVLAYIVVNPDGLRPGVSLAYAFWERLLTFNPLFRLPEFLLGVTLGRLFVIKRRERTADSARQAAPPGRLSGFVAALAMVGIAVGLAKGPLPLSLLDNALLDPLFALLIYNMAPCEGPLAGFFALPAMVLLGEASYALYILHYPVHDWLIHVLGQLHPGIRTESPSFFLVYSGLLIGLSMLSLRMVEQPARGAIRQALRGRSRARPSVSEQVACDRLCS